MKTAREIYADELGLQDTNELYDLTICEYQPMLNEFGEIICQVDDNDYQGDSFVLYRDGERYGYLNFGWGSCSGCDALQACRSIDEVQELMDELYYSIQWFDNIKSFRDWLLTHDWEGDYCWHKESFHEFYESVKAAFTKYVLPDGYIFKDENGNVINATKIVLEKKKKEYPKTYRECCKILEIDNSAYLTSNKEGYWNDYELSLNNLIELFRKLLICRDAYWKIAGDWKPEYPFNTARYVIANSRGFVGKVLFYDAVKNYILEFPTEEMRDAFYENFKELIEQCKELL